MDLDRSSATLTGHKQLQELRIMSDSINEQLEKDGKSLENSYFRTKDIHKELGYSTAVLSDIERRKRRQRLLCFLVLMFLLVGFLLLPCFRFGRMFVWPFSHSDSVVDSSPHDPAMGNGKE